MENPKSEEDGIEIMMNEKADEIIEELFYSTKNKYQNNLELKIASESVFYLFNYFIINAINHGGSCIGFPDWI